MAAVARKRRLPFFMSESSMQQIWAPWRMDYIKGLKEEDQKGCIFCWKPLADPAEDEKNLIVERREHCFLIMNLYPYNNSHLMVVPRRHTADFTELVDEELLDCQQAIRDAITVMKQSMNPQGFNVGINMGKAGGAGIDQHLHWHVIPRWVGDTNFFPLMSGVKVISESISDSWQRMHEGFKRLRQG